MSTCPESDSRQAPDAFLQLGLSPDIAGTLPARGIYTPSPIQSAVMPLIARGRDIIGCANTGSGKTAAYLLPVIDSRIRIDRSGGPQVLILADTWDLIRQIAEEAASFGAARGIRVAALYGGHPPVPQREEIRRGVHIAVGTLGRVQNFLRDGTIEADGLSVLILDEVDKLLKSNDSRTTVEDIVKRCPTNRQTLVFSATINGRTIGTSRLFMRNPEVIDVSAPTASDRLTHVAYRVSSEYEKVQLLIGLLRHSKMEKAIIFVRTNNDVLKLHEALELNGLSGSRPFCKRVVSREKNFSDFKSGVYPVLVASGLAERGLDIPGLTHIIHFDFPDDQDMYWQRTGRTNRMNYLHNSVVISFKTPRDDKRLSWPDKFPDFDVSFQQPLHPPLPGRIIMGADRHQQWSRQRIS